MEILEILGCLTVFIGVIIAIAYGTSKTNEHRWEKIEGSINLGIILGILAALGQAIGIIIMKPILDKGADPIASAAIRTGISAVALSITYFFPYKIFHSRLLHSLSPGPLGPPAASALSRRTGPVACA